MSDMQVQDLIEVNHLREILQQKTDELNALRVIAKRLLGAYLEELCLDEVNGPTKIESSGVIKHAREVLGGLD